MIAKIPWRRIVKKSCLLIQYSQRKVGSEYSLKKENKNKFILLEVIFVKIKQKKTLTIMNKIGIMGFKLVKTKPLKYPICSILLK